MSAHSYGATGDEWRARLDRFARSGLTVVRFCAREGVSTASFYSWRKRLAPQAFRQRCNPRHIRPGHGARRPASFQALTVVPAVPSVCIHLPGGARIEVQADDLDAVRAVIAEVARADARLQSDGEPC